jgi:hypothetical protein
MYISGTGLTNTTMALSNVIASSNTAFGAQAVLVLLWGMNGVMAAWLGPTYAWTYVCAGEQALVVE